MIREEIQAILDSLPEEELPRLHEVLKVIQRKYTYQQRLVEKGVITTSMECGSEKIKNRWDKEFTTNISPELKEQIHYSEHRWHIFSYGLQSCLEGSEARKTFNKIPKDELIVMYQRSPIVLKFHNAKLVAAEDFDYQQDIYIFDQSYKWTYINTHEEDCGPYFYQLR